MEYNITFGALIGSGEVVDLATAKQNSNIEHSDTESYLQILLDAAVEDAENYTGTSILNRNVTMEFSCWEQKYRLPLFPIVSITSVSYFDSEGAEQTLNVADYRLYKNKGNYKLLIKLDSFPDLDEDLDFPVKVVAVAGYADANMPAFVKSAVLLRFSHKEMYREDTPIPTSMDRAFQSALRPLKRW